MRPVAFAVAASLTVAFFAHGLGNAAVTPTKTVAASSLELVVYEHRDCTYCQVFRARITPRYLTSALAAEAPLRFVDITDPTMQGVVLRSPITEVPTSVLARNGREVDRLAGYWAPDNYFKLVGFLIDKAE